MKLLQINKKELKKRKETVHTIFVAVFSGVLVSFFSTNDIDLKILLIMVFIFSGIAVLKRSFLDSFFEFFLRYRS